MYLVDSFLLINQMAKKTRKSRRSRRTRRRTRRTRRGGSLPLVDIKGLQVSSGGENTDNTMGM